MDILDLIRIIGITFDNAIEESQKLINRTKHQSLAQVDAMYYQEDGDFEFEIRNRIVDENINTKDIQKKNYSTKNGHMGLGLSNVQKLAHKYENFMLVKYPVFICDDDQKQIDEITKIVDNAQEFLTDQEKVEFQITPSDNYVDAIEKLKKLKVKGGIYFLDIELEKDKEDDLGFDLAEIIKKQDQKAQVIFVTSYDDLSIITYRRRLGPIDYIVKTRDFNKLKQRIIATIEIAIDNLHKFNLKKKLTFSYKIGRRIFNVNMDDVIYVSTTATPHKLLLVETNEIAQFLGSINQYAQENPMLENINQSCLANPKNIKSIDLHSHRVLFVNGDVEDFSRNNNKRMREFLNRYNYQIEKLTKKEVEDHYI